MCRYGFGKFFTEKAISAQPLEDGIKDVERYSILKKRDVMSNKVIDFINKYLILILLKTYIRKIYLLMVFCWNYNWRKRNIIKHFLYQVKMILSSIWKATQTLALSVTTIVLLKAWQANIDLQPVYNYYMTAYLSKSENSASEAMKQAIGLFICSRQVSVEEAVVFVYQNYG